MSQAKPKKRDTSKKRNSILDAAIECFTEFGYDNTSMDTIAQRAQASKRTVYNHFDSKEALFQAVIKRFISTFSPKEIVVYQPDVPIDKQLEQILDTHIEMFINNTDWISFGRIALTVFISQPEITINVKDICDDVEENFIRWLEDARDDHRIQIEDVQMASSLFHATIDGLFLWPTMIGQKKSAQEAEQCKQHIIKSFKKLYMI